MGTMTSKAKLRQEIAEKLKNLTIETKKLQSQQVNQLLFESTEFKDSTKISVYLSTENEIDTKPIVEKIFEHGKKCFVPRYNKHKMEMVQIISMEDWRTLPLNSWKIKQPSMKEQRIEAMETGGLDLLIVPAVAYTLDGKRLGHGGGYYDKYIKMIREKQLDLPKTIGVAFKEQIVDDLPTEEHDEVLSKVLFPNV